MRSKRTKAVPARLEAGRRRFEAWRRTRKRGARIPERLWRAAAKLAGEYGVCRTARTLRLDYRGLKKRVQGDPAPDVQENDQPTTTFVELSTPALSGPAECVVEVENHLGSKMRVHFKGNLVPDVATLCREFWSVES